MRFSFDWLAQYVELRESPREIGDLLTSIGFAVESLEASEDDAVLDLEINPNRVDCMNHLGIARELAAALDRALVPPATKLAVAAVPRSSGEIEVEVEDTDDCPRYVALALDDIEVGPSPDWLQKRLAAVGVRPINNIVDVTNFVLWEMGQPLHAFDLERLGEARIVVRRAVRGEHLVTLDGIGRELDPEILVIADGRGPVALAGLMGGEDTEVTSSTRRVLLESAHFSPLAVRGSAKKLGMHTDASHRFERGTDFSACLRAARRAAELICEVAGGTASEAAVDIQASEPRRMAGTLDLRALERFSGTTIERGLIEQVFPALGFEIAPLEADSWSVSVPSWRRFDLEEDENGAVYAAHFYEEALRFHGYGRVAATLPEVGGPDAGSSWAHRRRERLRLLLSGTGLAETITYGFYDQASDRRFPTIGPAESPLRLTNALSEQYGLMRRSLLPNLVEGARFNLNRGRSAVRLFEIGHVFPGGASDEIEVVGLMLGGELGTAWTRRRELDLFDLKGVVEEMAGRAGLSVRFAAGDLEGFVGGTASTVHVDGDDRIVGYMGQVDEPELTVPLFAAELETAALDQKTTPKARVPSRFPGVAVDLTLTHASRLPWARISGAIEERRPQDLVSFELKDRYSGAGVPEGSVNTTISFFYNSDERSLTRDEVNERHEQLAAALRTVVSKEV